MKPGEQQFVDMMALRGWTYQKRPLEEKGCRSNDTWEFKVSKPAYIGQPPVIESVSIDSALHFRKMDRSVIVNLTRETVIDYHGYPYASNADMSAVRMSLNSFYEHIDALCGPLETPKPATPRDPVKVWAALRAAVG